VEESEQGERMVNFGLVQEIKCEGVQRLEAMLNQDILNRIQNRR
jgi:hypothetical protein